MIATAKRRGQPLLVLGGVLALWCVARTALWESPFPALPAPVEDFAGHGAAPEPPVRSAATNIPGFSPARLSSHMPHWTAEGLPWRDPTLAGVPVSGGMPSSRRGGRQTMASHQYLWLAALNQGMGLAEGSSSKFGSPGLGAALSVDSGPQSAPVRWSLDGWFYLRQGGARNAAPGLLSPVYGASQAGAILRYRFAPNGILRPEAYARLTAALAGPADRELAVGLAGRPLAGVPFVAQVEMRLRRSNGGTELRPAAMLVSEFPPLDLPAGTRAEAYVQAGYVGGSFATPFADGQARVTRELASFDLGAVRAGAGAWGGAQRGAARVDVGPSATVDMKVGDTPARLAVDYRLRVAGDAEPGSGVAVTLSSGF